MNKRTGLLALAVTAGLSTFSVAPAFATAHGAEPVEQVCGEGTSGKQDLNEPGLSEVTLIAPQGQLIASYCVKAGSSKQGNGPETVVLPVPQSQVTISHSSGKDISHYSYTSVPTPVVGTPVPEGPELPEVPTPGTPEVPETPETPEVPSPEAPATPAVPAPGLPETPTVPAPEPPQDETPVEQETPAGELPVDGTPVVVAPVEVEVPVTVDMPITPVIVDTPDNVLPVLDHQAVGVYYENCAEVRDVLGRAILLGEEGFRAGLDRDSDGVGCELDTDGDRTDEGADNTVGNSGPLMTDEDEATVGTQQLASTGTGESTRIAGGIGAGLLALGAGTVLAGRGRHRAIKA
ncbi:excalibur calcium-binding domain-containing protein [Arthrobacter sp. MDT2-16]